jgi:amino acid permease
MSYRPINEDFTSEVLRVGGSSTLHTAFNVICTVVGAGLLSLPKALAASGWVGVAILVLMGVMAAYTGVIIGRIVHRSTITGCSYGDMVAYAFGWKGKVFVDVQLYTTLLGVGVVYLVLCAGNLHSIFPSVSPRMGVLYIACLLSLHVFLKAFKEIGIVSTFNLAVAFGLFVVTVVEAFTAYTAHGYVAPEHATLNLDVGLGMTFAVAAFSYTVHPMLPAVLAEMEKPREYEKMIWLTFLGAVLFYVPMAVVGYLVFGAPVKSPIYDSLKKGPAVTAIIVAVTVHVLMSFSIIINVPERALEKKLGVDERPIIRSILRLMLLAALAGIAVALANVFGALLDLVSSLTGTFLVFVIPCCTYLKVFGREELGLPVVLWNVFIIIMSLIGGGFGLYGAIGEIKSSF